MAKSVKDTVSETASLHGGGLLAVIDEVLIHLSSKGGRPNKHKKKTQPLLSNKARRLLQRSQDACEGVSGWKLKVKQVLKFARSYLEIVYDYLPNFKFLPWESRESIIFEAFSWDNFEKCAKYCTVAPMAKYLRNTMPEKPQDDIRILPFRGRALEFLKGYLAGRMNKKALGLWNSILQGVKRGCELPSEQVKEQALKKHGGSLTKEPTPVDEIGSYLDRVLEPLRPPRSFQLKDTGGASFETTRSLGGKFEEVVRGWNGVSFSEPLCPNLLSFMTARGSYYGREVPTHSQVRSMVNEDPDKVKVVGLQEALKIRIITTGDAAKSIFLEGYRKPLHDLLRTYEPLKLIGAPKVQGSDLEAILQKEAKLELEFSDWVSGDYAAATDNLNMNATRQCIKKILSKLGQDRDIGLVESSLCGTQLCYPDGRVIPQTNGQLMGNPMSFPILCLVNLIFYWKSLEEYLQKEVDFNELPVLVNGDDILFRANPSFLRTWQDSIKRVGFELSLGKYYVHPRVATLNSQMFLQEGNSFSEVTYTNVGLLFGGFNGNKRRVREMPVDAIFSEYLRGCHSKQRGYERLLHYWRDLVKHTTRNGQLNLFLPRSAGGLGVNSHGVSFRVTKFQKQLAFALHRFQNWNPLEAHRWQIAHIFENKNNFTCEVSSPSLTRFFWSDEKGPGFEIIENKLNQRDLLFIPSHCKVEFQKFLNKKQIWNLETELLSPEFQNPNPPSFDHHNLDYDSIAPDDIERKNLKCIGVGEHRLERSRYDDDDYYLRTLDKGQVKYLRQNFWPSPNLELPEPKDRKLRYLDGVFVEKSSLKCSFIGRAPYAESDAPCLNLTKPVFVRDVPRFKIFSGDYLSGDYEGLEVAFTNDK